MRRLSGWSATLALALAAGLAVAQPATAARSSEPTSSQAGVESHLDFSRHRDGFVTCPRPWLETGFGLLSSCTFRSGSKGAAGFYSPIRDTFNPQTPLMDAANIGTFVIHQVAATDGVKGTFKGVDRLASPCCGPVTYGVQYTVFLLQPIGRWGTYSWITQRFAPASEWFHANHGI